MVLIRKLFVSYRSTDAPQVDQIAQDLALLRATDNTPLYDVWQDKKNIPPASPNWWDAIVDALIDCHALVFFVSRDSLQSDICRAELEYAHKRNRPIIPVVLRDQYFLRPDAGKYDIDYWALVPDWMQNIQFIFYTGAGFVKQFQDAINQFEKNWPKDINVPRPNNPGGKGTDHAIYAVACDYAMRLAFSEAEKYFRDFVNRNNRYYGELSYQWLEVLTRYVELVDMQAHNVPKKVFREAWDSYAGWITTLDIEVFFDPKQFADLPLTPQPPLPQGARGSETPPAKPDPVQEALTRARNFIHEGKKNADWTPFIVKFPDLKIPDMPFCLVPTGTFQMGSNDYDREKPIHPQTMNDPFYIAQYPVTNAQWRVAVKAKGVGEPQGEKALNWYNDPQMANAPVVGVSWFECQKFAEWARCRLPTEREWEYAARGVESLVYPWGNEFVADNVVYDGNSGGKPWDVTSKPAGRSWVGVSHLSGNVWEWQASLYKKYPYVADGSREYDLDDARRVLRGGSWDDGSRRCAGGVSQPLLSARS